MTPDQRVRLFDALLGEARAVVMSEAGENERTLAWAKLVDDARAQYRAEVEAEQSRIPGATVAATQAEVPVCHRRCGGSQQWANAPMFDAPSGIYCSSACRAAGRPLNPAPEVQSAREFVCKSCGRGVAVDEDGCCAQCGRDAAIEPASPEGQPVPTGYRLGEGWVPSDIHPGTYFVKLDFHGNKIAGSTLATAGSMGALVPVEPTAAEWPSKCQQDPCSGTHDTDEWRHLPRDTVGLSWIGKTDRAGNKIDPTAAPEGQQGEAKVSERVCIDCGYCNCRCDNWKKESRSPVAPAKASEPAKVGEPDDSIMCSECFTSQGCAQHDFEGKAFEAMKTERDAARAEVEQWKREAVDRAEAHLSALAEVEQLRAQLAGCHRLGGIALEQAKLVEREIRDANAREAAMRAAAAKVAYDRGDGYTAQAIERLPLSTGEAQPTPGFPEKFAAFVTENVAQAKANDKAQPDAPAAEKTARELIQDELWKGGLSCITPRGEVYYWKAVELAVQRARDAQPDAIKAAVTGRIADAFHEFHACGDDHFGRMMGADFEAWLRSGAPAPGAVGGGK